MCIFPCLYSGMHSTTEDSEKSSIFSIQSFNVRKLYTTKPNRATPDLRHVSPGRNREPVFGSSFSTETDFESSNEEDHKTTQTSGDHLIPTRTHHLRRLHAWNWEIGACFGSLIGFCAVAGLLAAYDGKPQPAWPYGITLNSATSFLVTFTKGSLLLPAASCISQSMWSSYHQKAQRLDNVEVYDAASRGPWGAMQLLCSFRVR